MKARKLREFRLRYNISLSELSDACNLTHQRISAIELGTGPVDNKTKAKILSGILSVVERRIHDAKAMENEYHGLHNSLLDCVEVRK